jgi:hypothetical protein
MSSREPRNCNLDELEEPLREDDRREWFRSPESEIFRLLVGDL